jgi:hypothetical protein
MGWWEVGARQCLHNDRVFAMVSTLSLRVAVAKQQVHGCRRGITVAQVGGGSLVKGTRCWRLSRRIHIGEALCAMVAAGVGWGSVEAGQKKQLPQGENARGGKEKVVIKCE